jgi:hypothetical protein
MNFSRQKTTGTIFNIVENRPQITPEGLSIPEFKKIWELDKDPLKVKATSELSYIYHTTDPRSPYSAIDEDNRDDVIRHDYGLIDWEPSDVVLDAIEKYNLFLDSQSVRLLRSARNVADRLAKYLDTIDFNSVGVDGKPHDPTKIVSFLSQLPELIKTLDSLKDQVEKQITSSDARVVGGQEFSTVFEE